MNKRFTKILTSIVTASTLLLGSSLSVFAATNNPTGGNNQATPSIQEQTAVNNILNSTGHINKVKEAEKNIIVPTLKVGDVVQKTIYVDNIKYVYTFGNKKLETSSSSLSMNNLAAATSWAGTTYTQIDAYDSLGFWCFSVGYNNDFSYTGTTVTAGTPYFTSSKAWWLVTFTLASNNMTVNNFGSYATSSGTAAVTELDTQLGKLFNYYYNGHATMNANGTSTSSLN